MSLTEYLRRAAGLITSLVIVILSIIPLYPVPTSEPTILTHPAQSSMATPPPANPVVEVSEVEAVKVTPTPSPAMTQHIPMDKPKPIASRPKGSKYDWMAAAGIPQSDWQYVDYIVTRESGWDPGAVNRSSGACGLMQFLPCSVAKAGANWNDPVNALRRGDQYAKRRYSSWAGAVAWWQSHHWW